MEEAGEELEDELLHAREEVAMLSEGMRKVAAQAEERENLLRTQSALQDELAAAREEIGMLESGMEHLKAQLGASGCIFPLELRWII